jgi:uncharacterized protein YkwD
VKTKQKQVKKPVVARAKVAKPATTRAQKMPIQTRVKHHAKKVLVPHRENQYRPHLIRAHGIIAVLVVALVAQATYSFVSTGQFSVLGHTSDVQTVELLADTNTEREEAGLSSLQLNDKLSQAAYMKAQNMFKEQYWAHDSPSGVKPWKWFGDVSYSYSYAGENLAKNYPTAEATVDAWMKSATHRENVLNKEYMDVGFAVVDGELKGENTTLVVALYGAPATAAVVQSAADGGVAATFSAPETEAFTPLAYFGSALEALSPVTIAILGLLAIVALVGVAAHHYRAKLPKAWKKSWKIHHGMYTFVGMITLGVLVIIATGGGQI